MTYKDDILNERGKTHGNFTENAILSQKLKKGIRKHGSASLSVDQREALDMICCKISRICTGNPNEADHWLDISGYAKLVHERLIAPGDPLFDDVTARTAERLELRRAEVASYRGPDKVSFTGGSRLGMVVAEGPMPQAVDGETGEHVTFSIT